MKKNDSSMSEECLGTFAPVPIFQLPLTPVCMNGSLDSWCLEVSLSPKTDAYTHSFIWDHWLKFQCPPQLEISSFIPATTAASPYPYVGSREHWVVGKASRCMLKHWPFFPQKTTAMQVAWMTQLEAKSWMHTPACRCEWFESTSTFIQKRWYLFSLTGNYLKQT